MGYLKVSCTLCPLGPLLRCTEIKIIVVVSSRSKHHFFHLVAPTTALLTIPTTHHATTLSRIFAFCRMTLARAHSMTSLREYCTLHLKQNTNFYNFIELMPLKVFLLLSSREEQVKVVEDRNARGGLGQSVLARSQRSENVARLPHF